MRVLFQARPDILTSTGGDAVQFRATAKHLAQMGVAVDVRCDFNVDCSEYDIVHLFNVTRPVETRLQLENAKRYNVPVALSTVYWNMDQLRRSSGGIRALYRYIRSRVGDLQMASNIVAGKKTKVDWILRRVMASDRRLACWQRSVLKGADILLPNSTLEQQKIYEDFPCARNALCAIVYNCIDDRSFRPMDSTERAGLPQRHSVICVGRIEPRKNQLTLIRALRRTSIPVTLIGDATTALEYVRSVRAEMKEADTILGPVPHEQLRELYGGSRVHVLPSLYETPGLASLEAGAMGCNLVMTRIGSQVEYFGSYPQYCEPNEELSIRRAVEAACALPYPNRGLQDCVRRKYTWSVAASQTASAYEAVLAER